MSVITVRSKTLVHTFTCIIYDLSMLAQAVTLLVSSWEVSGANVGYTTDYPQWHLSSPPTDKHWDTTPSGIFHHHLQTSTEALP